VEAWAAYERARAIDPQVAALKSEADKLIAAVGQAAGKGDLTGMERLMKQLDAVYAKLKVIQHKSEKERDAILGANEPHDFRVRIAVWVNSFSTLEKMLPAPPVAGLPLHRIPGRHVEGRSGSRKPMRFSGGRMCASFPTAST
jgi:hypothetical protein